MPPYRRGKFMKKRFARSRSVSRRRPTGGSFMKRSRTRAYANIRTGGLLAIERKFHDVCRPEIGLTPAGGSGKDPATGTGTSDYAPNLMGPIVYRSAIGIIATIAPSALNVLGSGDSGSDRDGRQVINDSVHLRGAVTFGAGDFGTVDACAIINIVLVLDTQTNGAAPGGGAIFVNPGDVNSTARYTPGAAPFLNLANSKRFRILKHIRRCLQPSAISGNGVVTYPSGGFIWAMDVPLKQMKTNYVADLPVYVPGGGAGQATVASIGDNGIFIFAWADNGSGVTFSYNSRLRFRG